MRNCKNFDFGYERQIDVESRRLHVNLTETDSRHDHTLRVLDIDSRNQTFKIGITNPLLRSRARNLSLYADFIVRNSHTTILNSTLSKDRVRFFSFGALYDNWSFLTNFTSQVASAKLLASEEFGVGGERCVRGYDPSEVTGDQGYCLLVEMRYGLNIDTTGYQLYGFYDTGEVRRKLAGSLGKTARLASAGLGIRLNYGEKLSGSVEVTWPQMNTVDSRSIDVDSSRIFASLTARF